MLLWAIEVVLRSRTLWDTLGGMFSAGLIPFQAPLPHVPKGGVSFFGLPWILIISPIVESC